MNNVQKGRRIERIVEKHLIEQGYETFRPVWNRFSQKDIFGLFDIIASNAEQMRLIQVKSNRVPKAVVELISIFKVPANVQKEIWIYRKRKPFEVIVVL